MTEATLSTYTPEALKLLLKPEDFHIGTPMQLESAIAVYAIPQFTEADLPGIINLAEQGNTVAQYHLALCYFYGMAGLEVDLEKAFHWNLRAASQGHTKALFNVAVQLFIVGHKHSDKKLVTRALEFFTDCANQHFAPSQYYLWRIAEANPAYAALYPSKAVYENRLDLLKQAAATGYPPAVESKALMEASTRKRPKQAMHSN